MGLNIHALRLLFHAKRNGASLDRVVTVGRLDALLTPEQVDAEFSSFGEPLAPGEALQLIHARDRYCEPIIERMGAERVDALDASDYEGANIVHDLNQPLDPQHKNKYSLLLDGGTLEHVFHFPEALKSCMSMVRVGGHALFSLPANNEMGHGFYQFSPELFFRAFSEENGYRMKGLYLVPLYKDGAWYEVEDPAVLRERVGFNSSNDQLGLLVFAERIADVPIFAKTPQQSDYVVAWDGASGNRLDWFDRMAFGDSKPSALRKLIPEPALRLRRLLLAGKQATAAPNPSQFRRFDPTSQSR